MGQSSSAPRRPLTGAEADLRFLADRFPFGDAELRYLYQAYQQLIVGAAADGSRDAAERTTFLTDFALAGSTRTAVPPRPSSAAPVEGGHSSSSSSEPPDEDALRRRREERLLYMSWVENQILPPDFGQRLYQTAFCVPGDRTAIQLYPLASNSPSSDAVPSPQQPPQQQQVVVDEYTRKARLEAFFTGLSDSGRRGSKEALAVLFRACASRRTGSADSVEVVRASELVDLSYRLAWAMAFLDQADQEEGDMAAYLPPTNQNNTPSTASAEDGSQHQPSPKPEDGDKEDQRMLDALAHSMLTRAQNRRIRQSILSGAGYPTGSTADDDNNNYWIELHDVLEWAEAVAPVFGCILPTFMFRIFFPQQPYPPSRTAYAFPRVPAPSSFFTHGTSPLLFTLGCLSSSLTGEYYQLYTSDSDGLSFNRLQNALLGYAGPTLLMIRTAATPDRPSGILGAFTASLWKESKDFYGSSDCFLFQMSPLTAVYRPTGNATNFMYCNSFARSRGYDQQAHGLGFGGTVDQPRLFLPESFDACVADSQDITFDPGLLLPKTADGAATKTFDLESLEVWGVGGDDVVRQALGARAKARELKEEGIRRARKVDKAQFLDDFRSGALSSKAFKYREQIDGRADGDIEDRVKPKYEYEK